ncbi:MAG: DNA-binding domain-containing protein [Emergencia sp.]|nr:DNA-binding domain-containing protein [Emergencia sp.]
MRYYLIDDEIGTVKTLENIVESRVGGDVIGYQTDPEKAVDEIIALRPDIVLVDLLMSRMDGIALVGKIKAMRSAISFIMISQVAEKGMIEQAYNAGVEFFIHKPINVIEVEKVLLNVENQIKMNSIMNNIKGMFADEASEAEEVKPREAKDSLQEINMFLGLLGMMGEKGVADIQAVCRYLITSGGEYTKDVLNRIAEDQEDSLKNIEQRIRRAIKKGMNNVAILGIDDYSNEIFQVYANYVFDFKNLKDEMDYIKGNSPGGGRVNISKFIEGLLLYRNALK